jgi:hypothetical protein
VRGKPTVTGVPGMDIDLMVAREGIELATKTLWFTAFHKRCELSYPRCYPHVILANRQLNRGHSDFQAVSRIFPDTQSWHTLPQSVNLLASRGGAPTVGQQTRRSVSSTKNLNGNLSVIGKAT